jgi:LPS-assembly lipoprotein
VPDNQPKALYPSPNLIPDSDQGTPMEQEGPDAIPNMATGRAPIDTNF